MPETRHFPQIPTIFGDRINSSNVRNISAFISGNYFKFAPILNSKGILTNLNPQFVMRNNYFKGSTWKIAFTCAMIFLFAFPLSQNAFAQNDDCANATTISPGGGPWTASTVGADPDTVPFCSPVGNSNGGGLWYKVEGTGQKFWLSTCNDSTNFDTEMRVYKGDCNNLVCVGSSDDVLPDSCSEVAWCTQDGYWYYILVTGHQGDEGTFQLSIADTGYADASWNGICPINPKQGTIQSCFACVGDDPDTLAVDGTPGGTFTGPGVVNDTVWDPTVAGVDTHKISYEVTDTMSGCLVSDTIEVIVYPMAVPQTGNDTTVCPGDIGVLDAGPADDWYWDFDGSTNQTLSVDSVGTYTFMMEDSNGCWAEDSLMLMNHAAPVVDLGNDTTICTGDSICLDAGSGVAVLWGDGDNNQVKCENKVATHTVTVTDTNGCSVSDTFSLGIHQLPDVDLGKDVHQCIGDTVTFTLDTNDVTWNWSDGGTEAEHDVVATDSMLMVTVTDTNMCSNSDTIEVLLNELPEADFRDEEFICSNDIANGVCLDAGDDFDSYDWSTGSSAQVECFYAADTAWVVLEDSVGCVDTAFVMIDTIDAIQVSITGNAVGCPDDTLVWAAGAGYEWYDWYDINNVNNPMPDDSIATLVYGDANIAVEVEDSNGCWSSDTMMVEFRPVPNPGFADTTIHCAENGTFCFDAKTQYSVSYKWQDNSTQAAFCPSAKGWKWVDITDDNGCMYRDSSYFNKITLVADLGPDTCLAEDSTMILDAGVSGADYEWDLNGVVGPNVQAIGYQRTTNSDTIRLRISDDNGCESDWDTLVLTPCKPINRENLLGSDQVVVYPNPNQGLFNVQLNNISGNNVAIQVFDVHGRVVLSRSLENVIGTTEEQLNVSNFGAGVYHVKVTAGDKMISKKITVF